MCVNVVYVCFEGCLLCLFMRLVMFSVFLVCRFVGSCLCVSVDCCLRCVCFVCVIVGVVLFCCVV